MSANVRKTVQYDVCWETGTSDVGSEGIFVEVSTEDDGVKVQLMERHGDIGGLLGPTDLEYFEIFVEELNEVLKDIKTCHSEAE